MTTKSPDSASTAAAPWWERLTDASGDVGSGKQVFKYLVIAAVVVTVALVGWNLFKGQEKATLAEQGDLLNRALALLPDAPPTGMDGILPAAPGAGIGFARFHYWIEAQANAGRNSVWAATRDPQAADEYVKNCESVLAELSDNAAKFAGTESEWRYSHAIQQVHFFAGLNATDMQVRKKHFDECLKVLGDMKSKYADHVVLGLHPDPEKPELNVMELFEKQIRDEMAFIEEHGSAPKLMTDEGLVVTIELESGALVKLKFYSRVAPKSVATFINNVAKGVYDGTAVHKVDQANGTLTLGSPFSREAADRKFIWHKADPGTAVPNEMTPLLMPKKGSIAFEPKGAASHPLHFVIHVTEPDQNGARETTFGEVIEGLEALEEWLKTEVHDEVGLENTLLPRVRLGIKKVTVEGQIAHPSDDSWQLKWIDPKLPEKTEAESTFEAAIKPAEPEENKPAETDDNGK